MKSIFDKQWSVNHQRTSLTGIHRKMMSLLDAHHVEYVIEKEFGPYSADIYIPSRRVIVETDGNHWHGGKAGTDHDRNRDKYILENHNVRHIYRVLGSDIENHQKCLVILGGILADNLITRPQDKGDKVILERDGKHYCGSVTRVNEYSYAVRFDRLGINVTMERNGLCKIDGLWFRCVEYTKENAIPIWGDSLKRRLESALRNRSIPECEEIVASVKKMINDIG